MKLRKSLPKLKRPSVLIRRVVGASMTPTLRHGQLVFGYGFFKQLKPRNIVIVHHEGLEKIKRVAWIEKDKLFLVGDNPETSTDSRTWGWLPKSAVRAKLVWPR